ncbi:4'-phosphopantetheinyl transferase [Wenjunlia tyrosinilytica]|uniref:4'-phosphopantetheinyl transferase n=2 Tax=Wenjunlia tyrosinilytica TaxID=1544741 RepID=A0A918DZT6_9ACTN|nr:4'-phosphopantetheinyl transferase [Wenjunlia tyrosinilytica]
MAGTDVATATLLHNRVPLVETRSIVPARPRPAADPGRADTDLWLLPESAVARFVSRVEGVGLLRPAERERLDRMRTEGGRRRFLGGRALCRYALSARTGLPMDSWRFYEDEFGRPEPEPTGHSVRFNLSHTDGLIACVVTDEDRACGVDVERTPAGPQALRHVPRHLAEAEQATLDAAPPGVRAAKVAAYWVLKEAYLKALGVGMTRGLSGFTFSDPAAGSIRVDDPDHGAADRDRWLFDLFYPSPGHVLAIAVKGARPGSLHRVPLTG